MEPVEATTGFEFSGLSVDFSAEEVVVDGETVTLTAMEFALLALLVRNAGKTLSRDHILRELRGIDAAIVTRSVDMLTGRLRRKLRDSGKTPRFIATIWGSGYCFFAEARRS